MAKGSSKTTSSQSTTQTFTDQSVEDNKVVASDTATGIGKVELAGQSSVSVDLSETTHLTTIDEFSDNVAAGFQSLLDFAVGAGSEAANIAEASIAASESTAERSQKAAENIATQVLTATPGGEKSKLLELVTIGGLIIGAIVGIKILGKK